MQHTHKNMQLVQGRTQAEKAVQISKSLGFPVAAKYLKARGWSLDAALWILCQKGASA